MALADILRAVREEGAKEIALITAQRDEQVAEIMRAARQRAEEEETAATTARDGAMATEAEVIRHRASLHVERRLHEAKELVFQEILGHAVDRLSHYRDDAEYPAALDALISESVAFLGVVDAVAVDPRDAELANSTLLRHGSPPVEATLQSWGGVVAHDGKGVFVRNTLEERLRRADADLRQRIGDLVPGLRHRQRSGAAP